MYLTPNELYGTRDRAGANMIHPISSRSEAELAARVCCTRADSARDQRAAYAPRHVTERVRKGRLRAGPMSRNAMRGTACSESHALAHRPRAAQDAEAGVYLQQNHGENRMAVFMRCVARCAAGNLQFAIDFRDNDAGARDLGAGRALFNARRRTEPGREVGRAGVACGRSSMCVDVWRRLSQPLRDEDSAGGESRRF